MPFSRALTLTCDARVQAAVPCVRLPRHHELDLAHPPLLPRRRHPPLAALFLLLPALLAVVVERVDERRLLDPVLLLLRLPPLAVVRLVERLEGKDERPLRERR
jgi:hypothetical protein